MNQFLSEEAEKSYDCGQEKATMHKAVAEVGRRYSIRCETNYRMHLRQNGRERSIREGSAPSEPKRQGFSDMHQARIVAVSLTRFDGELTMSTDYHGHVG